MPAPPARSPLERVGAIAGAFAERFIPDAWIYALLLTFVAYLAAWAFTEADFIAVAEAWQKGLWNDKILLLIAQFSINLLLCTALARTWLLRKLLRALASLPQSPRQAIALVALGSIALGLVSWALCIIGGAIFGQEVCQQARRRNIKVHYPLAIAAGYLGMMTFGFGLTSSAPLIVSTKTHHLVAKMGVIPFSETVFTATSIGTLLVLSILCPLLLAAMHPSEGAFEINIPADEDELAGSPAAGREPSFAERLESSALLLKLAALLPCSYAYSYYLVEGKGLTIDSMNLLFLCAAMLLYRTPRQLLTELKRASQGVWSIIFQFPFYAGLMGIITNTGLGKTVADGFVAISHGSTWPAIGVFFQGLCNLFVPSAGGQWIVTGEILVDASSELGYSHRQAVLIEVMGDQLTNMIQPMWALPALALSGLEARDILGYTAVVMVAAYLVMAGALTLFPV